MCQRPNVASIAHVVTLLSADGAYGGPTSVAWQQATALSHRNHRVTLLAGWDGRAEIARSENVDVRLFKVTKVIPTSSFSGLWAPGLHGYLAQHGKIFDVIHIHLGRDLITLGAAHIAAAQKIPYVAQPHGMIIPDPRKSVTAIDMLAGRRALRRARRVFSLTPEEDKALQSVAGGSLPLERLRNGIALDDAAASEEPDSISRNVLFCARLHPRKRVMAFADMAAELVKREVDATFSVVGPDEGDLDELRKRIEDPGLKGRLTYEGSLSPSAVRDRMRRAYVYVLPSINEPFPMTVLEAMAAGTPVVLTDSCHIAAELQERKAVLVTDGTSDSLADAVQQLLIDHPARTALRSRASDAIATAYSIDAVALQLEQAYRSITKR